MNRFGNSLRDAIMTRFPGATCEFNGHRDRYDIVIDGVKHRLYAAEINRLKIFLAEEVADAYEEGQWK